MPLPGAILAQMRDTVTVTLAGAKDAYGETAAGSSFPSVARVTYSRSNRETTRGDESTTGLTVYMPDIDGFNGDAVLLLPDGRSYPVKSYTRPAWPDGTRHLRVSL
jgi:hypothetical protein